VLRATGTFPVSSTGYRSMLRFARQWPDRVWAVEGAGGVGRPVAQWLLADGERVPDVPAKLAARARVFDTGQGRKTDATDAHAVVMVALRDTGLRELSVDADRQVLRLLCDRRDELSRARAQGLNRMHRLMAELVPGGAPVKKSVAQYQALLTAVRPRDPVGRTRRRLAAEQLHELTRLDARLKTLKGELTAAVLASGSHLMDVHGIGPAGAARILADVGDVARFPDRAHFASWTGTAPLDASSGEQIRHRLSRAGNRRLNHVLYIAAFVQLTNDQERSELRPSNDGMPLQARTSVSWRASSASAAEPSIRVAVRLQLGAARTIRRSKAPASCRWGGIRCSCGGAFTSSRKSVHELSKDKTLDRCYGGAFGQGVAVRASGAEAGPTPTPPCCGLSPGGGRRSCRWR
jgi:transposase